MCFASQQLIHQIFLHQLFCNSSNLVQADPESVAVEVRVLPGLSRLPGVRDTRLPGGAAGRGRGGVLLITEMFVLQNVVGVLPLKISRNRRHDGSVDREHKRLWYRCWYFRNHSDDYSAGLTNCFRHNQAVLFMFKCSVPSRTIKLKMKVGSSLVNFIFCYHHEPTKDKRWLHEVKPMVAFKAGPQCKNCGRYEANTIYVFNGWTCKTMGMVL